MANTSTVYARIDTNLKNEAEAILAQLGITTASLIQMTLSQVVIDKALPFRPRLPQHGPTCIGGMTEDEIVAEILKGEESFEEGSYTADEIKEKFARKYGML